MNKNLYIYKEQVTPEFWVELLEDLDLGISKDKWGDIYQVKIEINPNKTATWSE